MRAVTLSMISFYLILMTACSNEPFNFAGGDRVIEEIRRIPSPDKKVEAVVVATHSGATVADGNSVFLVLPGRKITAADLQYSCFDADHVYKLDIEWLQDKRLLINYDKARIFHFTNFWHSDSLDNWGYVVELTLKSNQPGKQLSE